MAKFLKGSDLNAAIEKLIESAGSKIFLVSPFIKLHNRIADELKSKISIPEIELWVLFGKNTENPSLSLGMDDLNFFKQFPNVDIRYAERLHAKYYANESEAVLTSMNLYDFSQNNNIEFGVAVKSSLLGVLSNTGDASLDIDASNYFEDVFKRAEQIFKSSPRFEKINLGLSKIYKGSSMEIDKTEAFFKQKKDSSIPAKKFEQSYTAPISQSKPLGYCIRTAKPIPFNTKRPFSDEAFVSWSKFSNPDYAEKYCHFSGEPSNGETTFSKPILKKNWSKAKEIHGF